MSTIATNERTNQALISVLVASNSQPFIPCNQALISALSACSIQFSSTALLVRPPTRNAVVTDVVIGNPPTHVTISTVLQAYPSNNVKL